MSLGPSSRANAPKPAGEAAPEPEAFRRSTSPAGSCGCAAWEAPAWGGRAPAPAWEALPRRRQPTPPSQTSIFKEEIRGPQSRRNDVHHPLPRQGAKAPANPQRQTSSTEIPGQFFGFCVANSEMEKTKARSEFKRTLNP